MKISSKIIATMSFVAAALVAGTFISCNNVESDDPEGAISGSIGKYTISYANETSEIYRGFSTTTLPHLGALVKIDVEKETTSSKNGVVGFIWDLQEKEDGDTTYRNFMILGFRNNSGKPQFYVSKFWNITDIRAEGFGSKTISSDTPHATATAGTNPLEWMSTSTDNGFISLESTTNNTLVDPVADDEGTYTYGVWADIWPVQSTLASGTDAGVDFASFTLTTNEAEAIESASYSKGDKANKVLKGSYIIQLYNTENAPTKNDEPIKTIIVPPSVTGYTSDPSVHSLAVYTAVYANSTLNGTVDFSSKAYGEAEVVEE